jgi:lipopolysaccharide transport system permease protein
VKNTTTALPPADDLLVVLIQPRKGWLNFDLAAVYRYRELLYFLIWRDVLIRYKQTAIGVAWVVLQPLLTMVIFTVIFGRLAKLSSDGLPYPVFSFAALLPWNYFSQAISRSGVSLVSNANLISKIYFPRLIVPISGALGPMVDFAVSFAILLVMLAWYGVAPTWWMLALPFFTLLAVVTSVAVSLFLSALNVKYRDVGQAIPFLVQFWMYASPVVYSVTIIPEKWRILYSLNPMVGVIEGFRWALGGKARLDFVTLAVGVVVALLLLLGGLIYFKRTERFFADII